MTLLKKNLFVKVVLGTVIWLIILESTARLLFKTPPKVVEVVEPDPILNHKWKPNLAYKDYSREIPYILYTNSQSFIEDHEISIKKPQNTIRIIFVGDSNTQGVVNKNKKMAKIVEKDLNNVLGGKNKQIETINMGTTSYSPSLYYLLIKNQVLKYSPDIVIINIDMTDVRDDFVYKKSTIFDKQGLPFAVKPTDIQSKTRYRLTPQGMIKISEIEYAIERINLFLRQNSTIYYHLQNFIYSLPKPKSLRRIIPKPYNVNTETDKHTNWLAQKWTEDTKKSVDYSMSILEKIVSLLKEHKIKTVITGVPHYPQYTGEWSTLPHKILEKTAQKQNVPYLNSFESLKKYIEHSKQSKYYWESDPTHFNEEGNKIWAEALISFILDTKNQLLPIQP